MCHLRQSGDFGSCFFDALLLDWMCLRFLDGENKQWKNDVILYISTVTIYKLFIMLILCKILGCRTDFKA